MVGRDDFRAIVPVAIFLRIVSSDTASFSATSATVT